MQTTSPAITLASPSEPPITPRAAYRALLTVLRDANARGRGRLDSTARQAADFRTALRVLRVIVRPWLTQFADAQHARAAADAMAASATITARHERESFDRLAREHAAWWQAVTQAGIAIRPTLDGWHYQVPAIADTWDGPYATAEAALGAAITALITRSGDGPGLSPNETTGKPPANHPGS